MATDQLNQSINQSINQSKLNNQLRYRFLNLIEY